MYLIGYLRATTYYAGLGVPTDALDLGLQGFMVGSIPVLGVLLIASFLALLANAFFGELARRSPAANDYDGEIKDRHQPVGLPVETVGLVLAVAALMHESLLAKDIRGPSFMGNPATTWAFTLLVPLGIGIVAAMRTREGGPMKRVERWSWLGAKLLAWTIAVWYSGQPLFWVLLTVYLLFLVASLQFLIRAWKLYRISKLKEDAAASDHGAWRVLGRRLNQAGAITRPIAGGFTAFLAAFAILIVAIVQGSSAARHELKDCTTRPILSFDDPAAETEANRTYWLVLHASGNFYLKAWNQTGVAERVLIVPDSLRVHVNHGLPPWCTPNTGRED